MPAAFSTSGRIDAEFLRLLFYHAHRESEEFFKLTGQLAQPNQDYVFSKRAAFPMVFRTRLDTSWPGLQRLGSTSEHPTVEADIGHVVAAELVGWGCLGMILFLIDGGLYLETALRKARVGNTVRSRHQSTKASKQTRATHSHRSRIRVEEVVTAML